MKRAIAIFAAMASMYVTPAAMQLSPAHAEVTECIEITSIPTVISGQGVYCLKQNLSSSITNGKMIEIKANNVTIEMNGFKLGGSHAGSGSNSYGIYAADRKNITVRNGTIRGFRYGASISGSSSFGHLVENVRFDGNLTSGLRVGGDNVIVRNNHVLNTGPVAVGDAAYGINIYSGNFVVVTGNVIGGVSETRSASGILVNYSDTVTITDNFVFDIKHATNRRAVSIVTSDNVMVENNRFNNGVSGTIAIYASSSADGIDCVGNMVRGFASGSSGCDYSSGNHVN